ncbi:MAG: hydantoinase/oxoprolinase family protein [Albidovulum sp.]|nr:hydantoinase/oxoprolinase family protein [Albidovulum sp.]
MAKYKFSIDIGGTFIDAVLFDFTNEELVAFKLPTTPEDPAAGVIAAAERLNVPVDEIFEFVHGTTLGLNAILERKGTTVGIITNSGFEDIFEIGRGNLNFTDMYRFDYEQSRKIVERRHVRGVGGRIDSWGREVAPLDVEALRRSAAELARDGECKALAVSFLHSYANDAHEVRAVELLHREFPGVEISSGAALAREYREYERTSTAVLDAYIKPVLKNYLGRVSGGIESLGFNGNKYIMNSSGGALTFDMGEANPVSTVMSGPAGGVAGALYFAKHTGKKNILSIDIGGTSLDACLIIDFEPTDVFEAEIDNFPILQPIFDIRNLGAGGGSIARVDHKLLRVGPQSAGAVPGPACYGRGGKSATVTDAALMLGYLDSSDFMSGELKIAKDLALAALSEDICKPLSIGVDEAAKSIFEVLVSRTSSSIKEMLLERGRDPRDFTLLAFGGCGPLLGPMIQRELEIPELLIPPLPSVFSAWGMMASDLSFSDSTSVLESISEDSLARLRSASENLAAKSLAELRRRIGADVAPNAKFLARIRFIGQEHTLSVDYFETDTHETLFRRFSDSHLDRFGHTFDEPAEIVSLSIRLTIVTRKPAISRDRIRRDDGDAPAKSEILDMATGALAESLRSRRSELQPGFSAKGPMLVKDEGSTLVIHGDQQISVEENGVISVSLVER